MSQFQIAVLVGSMRKESHNVKFAHAVAKLAPAHFAFEQINIGDLPHYNQDEEKNPTDAVKHLKTKLKAAQGVLIVTPEYNRSIPGVLKNAIDHASRPYGESVWARKPVGIMGVSPGASGTAMAQQHLRNILAVLDTHTLGQPEIYIQVKEGLFDADGNIGAASKQFLQKWMDRYVAWVEQHAA